LKSDGTFYLLLPAFRKQECIEVASNYGFYPCEIADVKQSERHQPFRAMFSFQKAQIIPKTESITIMELGNKYSTRFTEILKDYYLYL
jgi:tRNA1Val (adenine37-N6)-methyltransferase